MAPSEMPGVLVYGCVSQVRVLEAVCFDSFSYGNTKMNPFSYVQYMDFEPWERQATNCFITLTIAVS